MSTSYTVTESVTFNVTHARHLASKVGTDLKRLQRFYGEPSDIWIDLFERELIELLKYGYLGTVKYGFQRNGDWIEPTLSYDARDLASGKADDDDPGKVQPGASVSGAAFHSYLTYSPAWTSLSASARASFEKTLPVQRVGGAEPGMQGYLVPDRTYSAGGRSLGRSSLKGKAS